VMGERRDGAPGHSWGRLLSPGTEGFPLRAEWGQRSTGMRASPLCPTGIGGLCSVAVRGCVSWGWWLPWAVTCWAEGCASPGADPQGG